ncbi:MAG TPA: hypothetical protein VKA07_03870 [Candidatus Sulfotelmatobacter sp.]|nr:hypothetical protein [Candidatus Sulfotelmatobacter sp.]
MKRIAYLGLGMVLATISLGLTAAAQDQAQSNSQNASPSLGDYAKQIRKSPETNSKPRAFDNDNLPKDDKLSVVGQAPAENSGDAQSTDTASAPTSGDAKASTDNKATAPAQSAGSAKAPEEDQAAKQAVWKQWGEKIASQKDQIDLLNRELSVLQKEYQLRAAAMYADVGNRFRNSTDWDKQDAQYKQQIADKQKQVDDANQKLTDLQEDARKAGVPSSIAEP